LEGKWGTKQIEGNDQKGKMLSFCPQAGDHSKKLTCRMGAAQFEKRGVQKAKGDLFKNSKKKKKRKNWLWKRESQTKFREKKKGDRRFEWDERL